MFAWMYDNNNADEIHERKKIYDLSLWRLGFELPTFRLRDKRSNRLR